MNQQEEKEFWDERQRKSARWLAVDWDPRIKGLPEFKTILTKQELEMFENCTPWEQMPPEMQKKLTPYFGEKLKRENLLAFGREMDERMDREEQEAWEDWVERGEPEEI